MHPPQESEATDPSADPKAGKRQVITDITGFSSLAMGLVVVHFRRVSQQNNHDPEVKQSLRRKETVRGLFNNSLFATGPLGSALRAGAMSTVFICILVSATLQGAQAMFTGLIMQEQMYNQYL